MDEVNYLPSRNLIVFCSSARELFKKFLRNIYRCDAEHFSTLRGRGWGALREPVSEKTDQYRLDVFLRKIRKLCTDVGARSKHPSPPLLMSHVNHARC